jgi:predicted HD phosphohydrolase
MDFDDFEESLMSLAGVYDGSEPVDELNHALQCASLARDAGASSELVVAALFHDVARSPLVAPMFPGVPHEVAGGRWLLPRFGEFPAWVVKAHVSAKLYLLESEPDYRTQLSEESLRSAGLQRSNAAVFPVGHPWWWDAVQLRRWDDAAKNPSTPTPNPEAIFDIVRNTLTSRTRFAS